MRNSNVRGVVPGTTFHSHANLFRPTALSVAMAAAGMIPDVHLIGDKAATATIRNRNDNRNQRNSVKIVL